MIGTIILGILLFIIAVEAVLLYICLILANPTKRIASEYRPRRRVVRTLYGKDWDRITEMTKLEKGGKRRKDDNHN